MKTRGWSGIWCFPRGCTIAEGPEEETLEAIKKVGRRYSAPVPSLEVGAEFVVERTFTAELVDAFTEISGDRGRHHLQPDAQGRRIVHGLLVASLGTQIGGSLNFLSRTMDYEFLRPVYVGDTVKCTPRIETVEGKP